MCIPLDPPKIWVITPYKWRFWNSLPITRIPIISLGWPNPLDRLDRLQSLHDLGTASYRAIELRGVVRLKGWQPTCSPCCIVPSVFNFGMSFLPKFLDPKKAASKLVKCDQQTSQAQMYWIHLNPLFEPDMNHWSSTTPTKRKFDWVYGKHANHIWPFDHGVVFKIKIDVYDRNISLPLYIYKYISWSHNEVIVVLVTNKHYLTSQSSSFIIFSTKSPPVFCPILSSLQPRNPILSSEVGDHLKLIGHSLQGGVSWFSQVVKLVKHQVCWDFFKGNMRKQIWLNSVFHMETRYD